MNALLKKPRKLRVERMGKIPDAGGEDGHSWAVSYADFLMVLLSFFVVFFSQDEKKTEILIDIITASQGPKSSITGAGSTARAGASAGTAGPGGPTDGSKLTQEQTFDNLQAIAAAIPGFEVRRDVEKSLIILNFPDNIYPPGQYVLTGEYLQTLDDILIQLKNQPGNYDIRFVGHTDDVQVSSQRRRALASNFDLSSLRASRALDRAVKIGIPPGQLSTKGQAEHSRNSRTLSVVVVSQGGGL